MSEPIEPLAGALAALLKVPTLAKHLRRTVELAETLGRLAAERPLPPGVRSDIGWTSAALALAPSFADLMRF